MGRLFSRLVAGSKCAEPANPAIPLIEARRPQTISEISTARESEIRGRRPIIPFRLPDHPTSGWATAIGRPGESVADLRDDILVRWPGAEVAP